MSSEDAISKSNTSDEKSIVTYNTNKKHHDSPPKAPILESKLSVEDWARSRLENSRGLLESLGAFMTIESNAGRDLGVASDYEKRFLEFCQRPVVN